MSHATMTIPKGKLSQKDRRTKRRLCRRQALEDSAGRGRAKFKNDESNAASGIDFDGFSACHQSTTTTGYCAHVSPNDFSTMDLTTSATLGSTEGSKRKRSPEEKRTSGRRHRSPAPRRDKRMFCELFAGVAGLSAAVRDRGIPVMALSKFTPDYSEQSSFDLLRQADFDKLIKMIKRGKIRWLHCAPPCKTFSRARRSDGWAHAAILRSETFPVGTPRGASLPWKVIEGNVLARRTARLCKLQARSGGFFSIENPERSYMWLLPAFQHVACGYLVGSFAR